MIANILSFFSGNQLKLALTAGVLGAIIAIASSTYFYISSLKKDLEKANAQVVTSESNNKILQSNNEVLRDGIKKWAAANQANLDTIEKLLEERKGAQEVINNLAVSTIKDKKSIAALNKRLDDLLKDPKNDGIVSPALRETIRGVQESRKQK